MAADIMIDPAFQGTAQHDEKTPLIDGVVVSPVTQNVDDRQNLMVYLKESDPFYKGFAQSYVSVTAEGVVKAWHYHLKQTDIWFVPLGKIKVGLFDARGASATCGVANSIIMGGGRCVTLVIPPGVFHGYVSLTPECVLVNTTDRPYDATDEFRAAWNDERFGFDWSVENR